MNRTRPRLVKTLAAALVGLAAMGAPLPAITRAGAADPAGPAVPANPGAPPAAAGQLTADQPPRELTLVEAEQLALEGRAGRLAQLALRRAKIDADLARGQKMPSGISYNQAGLIEVAKRTTEAGERLAEAKFAQDRQDIATAARTAYLDVLKAEQAANLASLAAERVREQLRITRAAYEAGTRARAEVLSAEADVATAEADLARARAGRDAAVMALNLRLGLPVTTPLRLTTPFVRPDPAKGAATIDLAEAVRRAREGSLTVVSAREGVAMAEATFDFNKKLYGPGVGEYDKAEIALEEARLNLEEARDAAELAARSAYQALLAAEARVAAQEQALAAAQEARRLAVLRFEAGMATSAEVLGFNAALAKAELDALQALYDFNAARANFAAATGASVTTQPRPASP